MYEPALTYVLKKARPLVVVSAIALGALATACESDGGANTPFATPQPFGVLAFGAEQTDGEGQFGLYLVRGDGSDLLLLVSEGGTVDFPVWSPDGDRIAYMVGASPATLRVFDTDTRESTTISERALSSTFGPVISWSPDSERLAFVETTDAQVLRIYDTTLGAFVDTPELQATSVSWSSEREGLAIVSRGEGGEPDIHLLDANYMDRGTFLERPGTETGLRWSPDGSRLAFASTAPEPGEVLVLDIKGGEVIEVGVGMPPVWAPDGERLAYSGPAAPGATSADVYIVDAGGGEPERLSEAATQDLWPSWSPRGDAITYLAQADRRTAFICVVRLEPAERDCLNLPGLLPAAPVWAPG